jgi:hypothetical protein
MILEIGRVYKAQSGNYLRLESKGSLLCNFILVDKDNVPIPEKKNRFGHVVVRSQRQYSEEIITSFKLMKKHE